MATPIWQDYTVNLGTVTDAAYIRYRVYLGSTNAGTLIYIGAAYPRPGETSVKVKINDICADYLAQVMPAIEYTAFQMFAADNQQTFAVYRWNQDGQEVLVGTYTPYLDYGFEPGVTHLGIHDPITGVIEDSMLVPFSVITSTFTIGTINATYASGQGSSVNAITTPAPFNAFIRATLAAGLTEDRLTLAGRKNNMPVIGASQSYTVRPYCHRWALYYVNSYGGWDCLVIEGKAKQTDAYARTSFKREYDNTTNTPGEAVIGNEITRTWELHTGYLTDDQAGRMGHLLGSNLVYLFDLAQMVKYYPVIITNKDYPVKEYRADGMVSYQIDVKLANTMNRR